MLEMMLALGLLGFVSAALWVFFWLPWAWLVVLGGLASFVGMVVGIPAALRYHLLLYRALRVRGQVPAGWWVSPQKLHATLDEPQRARVLPWWWLGGAGFMFVIAGAGLLGYALWARPVQPPDAAWLQWFD